MRVMERHRRLLALCAMRVGRESVDWSLVAREAQSSGGLDGLWRGEVVETSETARRSVRLIRECLDQPQSLLRRVDDELEAADRVGAALVTVLDDSYPANLRLIPNLPPFLFYRGEIAESDARSVAVVGTRQPSEEGTRRARRMASALAQRGVTVLSGLARGVDTAAHRAALDAGGRTVAVVGTGITKTYPAENVALAEEIVERGALVSQFWPTRAPGRDTFPRRNVVMSGLGQGTVVIEASKTSGAKMQARLALEHGKMVFLVRSLVADQPWAKKYVAERGAIDIDDVEQVVRLLADPERIRTASNLRRSIQLALL